MKKIVFLPQWYVENKEEQLLYKCKLALVIILCLNVILLSFGINSYNSNMEKQKNLSKDNAKIQLQNNKSKFTKDLNTLNTMNYFAQDFSEKINCCNVELEDRKISFETTLENNKYYEIIKHIEEQKRYKIISISQIENNAGIIKIKLSLEVLI